MQAPHRFLWILLAAVTAACRHSSGGTEAESRSSSPPVPVREEHIAYGRAATTAPALSPRFGALSRLTDGLPGDPDTLTTFAGFAAGEVTVTIDLGEPLMAERLRAGLLFYPQRQVVLPEAVEFFISLDSLTFKSRGRIPLSGPTGEDQPRVVPVATEMRAQPLRYVRLRAYPRPDDRTAAASWILIDEVWVE